MCWGGGNYSLITFNICEIIQTWQPCVDSTSSDYPFLSLSFVLSFILFFLTPEHYVSQGKTSICLSLNTLRKQEHMNSDYVQTLIHLQNKNDQTPLGGVMALQTLRMMLNAKQDHSYGQE
jgi:hypothetical protein